MCWAKAVAHSSQEFTASRQLLSVMSAIFEVPSSYHKNLNRNQLFLRNC